MKILIPDDTEHKGTMQHWGDRIRILEEHPNPLPRCEHCGSQVLAGRLLNRHYTS